MIRWRKSLLQIEYGWRVSIRDHGTRPYVVHHQRITQTNDESNHGARLSRDVKQIPRIMDQNYRYIPYRYPGQDLDTSQSITREDISAFEVEQTLDIRSSSLCRSNERFSSLCDMLFCLSEDNILEDLLSVGGRVRLRWITQRVVREKWLCSTRFPWRRAKCLCVLHDKVHCLFP